MLFSALTAALLATSSHAQPVELSTSAVTPTYVSLAPTLNDFTRFADGGPDGNWYVGFNNAWIVKLPPPPAGEFARAFIGARVGRAKTRPNPNKPWIREMISGKVYIAISQTPAFTTEQSYFLAETTDIPVENDPNNAVEGVGAAEWFWAEVPMNMISFTRPNYLAVWSPTKYFMRASSSPILAAAVVEEKGEEPVAWNNRSISGVPPRVASTALETPMPNFYPAIAIRLIPPTQGEVVISDFRFVRSGKKGIAQFSVAGEDVTEAWVEQSRDQLDWTRATKYLRKPPFSFSLGEGRLPPPGFFVRGAARDASGVVGNSEPVQIPYAPR